MGDIAEMMLDGTLCERCGSVFPDIVPTEKEFREAKKKGKYPVGHDSPGYPRTCCSCLEDQNTEKYGKN